MFLKRKIASWLIQWKKDPERLPLIVKGARQIGKTESIRHFGKTQYKHYVEINFILQKQYRSIFDDGFDVDQIIKNITFINPSLRIVPHETLIFFDEIQVCINGATSLKAFKLDGRYDVICSGSLMGINYQEIESNSVGYKQDYVMYSLDFEEFLWAKGYQECQIEDIYQNMQEVHPLSVSQMQTLREIFSDLYVKMIILVFYRCSNKFCSTMKKILRNMQEDSTKRKFSMFIGPFLYFWGNRIKSSRFLK